MKLFFYVLVFCSTTIFYGQVKIGDNISTIDASSILELESTTKAFVPTRLTNTEMMAMTPLNGALVYNTDNDCIFLYDGSAWKSLCNSGVLVTTSATAPTHSEAGDVWINEATNEVSIYNGFSWVVINTNPRRGVGAPTASTVSQAIAGDIYVDSSNGQLYTYDGTNWQSNSLVTVGNGISTSTTGAIELGGTLNHATVLSTNETNTLAIEGLNHVTDNTIDLVAIDKTTGVLRKTSMVSAALQREEVVLRAANGQRNFSTPIAISSANKIDVYRNGVKVNFEAAGANAISLEAEASCYENDEIRIVQYH